MRALIYMHPASRRTRAIPGLCAAAGIESLVIFPRAKGGAQLSAAQYRARFGDDIDFAAIALVQVGLRGDFTKRKFLDLDSPFYRRLRAAAAEVDGAISDFRPDVLIVAHGMWPIALAATAKALRRNIPLLFLTGGIIPGDSIALDRRMPLFMPGANSMEAEWDASAPLSAADKKRADDFIAQWRQTRDTVIPTPEDPREARAVEAFARRDNRPLLLFAQQGFDFTADFQLPVGFSDYAEWIKVLLAAAPDGWKVVVKKHPRDFSSASPAVPRENQMIVGKVNLRRLINMSDCVATMTSNAGMEAALAGKPAIVCGRTFFSGKGIALEPAPDAGGGYCQSLGQALLQSRQWRPSQDALRRFVARVILDYFVWPGEVEKFRARLRDAVLSPPPEVGDPRRPLCHLFPPRLQNYARAINDLVAVGGFESAAAAAARWFARRRQTLLRGARKRLGMAP